MGDIKFYQRVHNLSSPSIRNNTLNDLSPTDIHYQTLSDIVTGKGDMFKFLVVQESLYTRGMHMSQGSRLFFNVVFIVFRFFLLKKYYISQN